MGGRAAPARGQNAIATRHALSNSQRRTPPAPDRRGDRRARPVPARKPGPAHDPLRLCPLPLPQRPQPAAWSLPDMDPQSRSQDHHPHAQPRAARAVPPPVRQRQAPSRADQRARDAPSRNRRASRRMDNTMRAPPRLQQLQRRHTPDNASLPGLQSRGPYSEDTQIRTPDNGGYTRGREAPGKSRCVKPVRLRPGCRPDRRRCALRRFERRLRSAQ